MRGSRRCNRGRRTSRFNGPKLALLALAAERARWAVHNHSKLLKNDFSCGVLHVSHYRGTRRALTMMGHQPREESLFYSFRLEDQIPETHLLRLIDRYVDFSFVRDRLQPFYSSTGRPSIDPEVLLRLLLVGYLYGISSERRLLDEVRMHLAYR